MTERLSKLLCVKSILTLCLTIVFCVLCLKGVISGEQFMTVFATVIAFYFGTQSTKNVKVGDLPLEVVAEDTALPLETITADLKPDKTTEATITE